MTLVSPSFFLLFLPLSATLYSAARAKYRVPVFLGVCVSFAFLAFGAAAWILLFVCALTLALRRAGGFAALPALCALVLCRLFSLSCGGLAFLFLRAVSYAFSGEKREPPLRDAVYLFAFPALVMGPTALYPAFSFDGGRDSAAELDGLVLYALGFFKKCAFADLLYAAARQLKPSAGTLGAWIALTAFCLGLYFDFSGYTDMARGLAQLFGFSLPQNFDHPYAARSVGDFFRRWHESFGKWLLTYIYLPLGGSKHGKAKLVLSLFAVWTVSALWHGASLCYLLWGLWFFGISLFEKICLRGRRIGNFCTLLCVWIGFVFFLCKTPSDAAGFLARLFWIGGAPLCAANDVYHLFRLAPLTLLAFLVARGGFAPLCARLWRAPALLRFSAAALLFFAGVCELSAGGHQPFLYAGF